MTQNAHENEQPSWIFTNARVRSSRALALHAGDGADVARDGGRCVLAGARDDVDVVRQPGERSFEIRRAAGHVDAPMTARRARRGLARLRDGLVRHAARVHHRDLARAGALLVPVRQQALARQLRIHEGHLAAEEAH